MPDYIPQLFLTARKLRQLTQKEVASEIGISQGVLSKIECGKQQPDHEIFKKMCTVYDVPESFFEQAEISQSLGSLYYRKRVSISDKIIDSFQAKLQIFNTIIDNMMEAVELPSYTLGDEINKESYSPKDIAHKVRRKLKLLPGPVQNICTLLENNGIIIVKFDFGTEKIDGLTTTSPSNRKLMFINSQMPNDRIRFSMAHELGHLIMHINKPYTTSLEDAENEADQFASEFLMPEQEIKPMLEGLTIQKLAILKSKWKVSMHALVRRAKDLGTIDQDTYRNLQINFSKKGYTKSEPVLLPVERPTILKETIQLYKQELNYTDEALMSKIMHINETDYYNWFNYSQKIIPMFQL